MRTIRNIITLIAVAFSTALFADEVTLSVDAPRQVVVGAPFQLTYSANDHVSDLRAPEFTDFDLLAGPYTSQSSSMSFVNGHRSSSYTMTFTYTLRARKAGTFTIGPASVVGGGKRISSGGVRITVLPDDQQAQGGSNGSNPASGNDKASASNGGNGQLFVRTIVSKTHVAEQEALTLTYKLYFANVDVAQLTNNIKLPDFTGFLKQDIALGEHQAEMEHYNGRNYRTYTIFQTQLYPQHSGKIHIGPASFEAIVRVPAQRQVRSIFDDFFDSYQNVSKTLSAPGADIVVDALPAGKPADYCGAVGHFTLNDDISAKSVPANEAITIRLSIRGTGNMKLIKTPSIEWPEGFEAYDPKVTNDFKNTANGMSGTKNIEYLVIPRAAGDYTIPAVHFSYYDTESKGYKTLSAGPYAIHVDRGTANPDAASADNSGYSNYVGKEDIRQLGNDIRYIHTGEIRPAADQRIGLSSLSIALLYLVPTLLTILILIIMHRRIQLLADAAYMRLRKAKRTAAQHIKAASKAKDDTAFWTEIERACRAAEPYVDVSSVLEKAEYARYAPSAAGTHEDILNQTKALIAKLEEVKL